MNVRKGMKRLALFVGVLGAIAGGVASYMDLSDVLAARARHNAFERLAASDVVQQQRKLHQTDPSGSVVIMQYDAQGNPIHQQQPQAQPHKTDPYASHGYHATSAAVPTTSDPKTGVKFDMSKAVPIDLSAGHVPIPPPPPGFYPSSYQVNKGGIQTILWTNNYAVQSIVMEDGQIISPEPAPGFWPYLLPVFFPVFGFFIPWGLVTSVVWVGTGFFEAKN